MKRKRCDNEKLRGPRRPRSSAAAATLIAGAKDFRLISRWLVDYRRRAQPTLPWIPYRAISYLDSLADGARIIEFGGGGSTRYLAKRAATVTTVESNPVWVYRLRRATHLENLHNVSVLGGSLPDSPHSAQAWADRLVSYLASYSQYDLAFIDYFDHQVNWPNRPALFRAVWGARLANLLVLDDSWRYPQVLCQFGDHLVADISGLGPYRRAASSTAFFSRE